MATPLRSIRIPDELWFAARDAAAAADTTLSAVVVDALQAYVVEHPPT